MGLDVIEMIMEIEEKFNVRIPDPEAQKFLTVGDLINCVCSKVPLRQDRACPTSRTFYRLRRGLMNSLGVSRGAVRLETPVATLIPRERRQAFWQHLSSQEGFDLGSQGFPYLPDTKLSEQARNTIQTVIGIILVAMVVVSALVLAVQYQTWLALLAAVPLSWLTWILLRPLAAYLLIPADPRPRATIRDLVLDLTPPDAADSSNEGSTREEIAARVRRIIVDNLGANLEELTDETRFSEDLGAD